MMGSALQILFGMMGIVTALVFVIGLFAKWDSTDIKVRAMVVNAVILVGFFVFEPKLKLHYYVKVPADMPYIEPSENSRQSQALLRLTPTEQALVQAHLSRTYDLADKSERGQNIKDILEKETEYAKKQEQELKADIQAVLADDGQGDLRQMVRQGVKFELVHLSILPSKQLQLDYQVINDSELDLRGITAGLQLIHQPTKFEMHASNYCVINRAASFKPDQHLSFRCESRVLPEIILDKVKQAPLTDFGLRPKLQYVQLPQGKSLMM